MLIIIFDGSEGKIFKKEKFSLPLAHLESLKYPPLYNQEHDRNKPGRGFGKFHDHHAYGPAEGWHELQKESFLKEFCVLVKKFLEKERPTKVYFIGPAKSLGAFREISSKAMKNFYKSDVEIFEIKKDLVHATNEDIDKILETFRI
ncbi:MAG TPA: host attachment protein [Bdellovibrionota bacterium]|nr:host attachment protein [Bdellovibrionota bacterium]